MHILAYSDIFKHEQKCSQAHWEHSVKLEYLEPWYIQYQKHIQNRAIFRTLTYSEPWYIQTHGIFRTLEYSEPFYIQNPSIFRALVNSEPWYIQKHGIFRSLAYSDPLYIQNPGIFRALEYSEPWYIQSSGIFRALLKRWSVFTKIINGYNYFHNINLSSSPLFEQKYDFFDNLYSRSIYSI